MGTIYTKRLILRPFKTVDAEAMYKNWTADKRVAKYCRWYPHKTLDTTKELLETYLNEASQGFEYRWAIVLKGTDEPIGAIDVVDADDEQTTAEIGYVLSYDYWSKGYMTEALQTVIDELFYNGFTIIKAKHHTDNSASGRVMEKCGMKFLQYDKDTAKFGSDELCDVKVYQTKKADIHKIDKSNVSAVARLMSAVKPDWWDFEGACGQLRDVSLLAKLIGWYMGDGTDPQGWILCAEYEGYSYLSIECLGYSENGSFVMEEQLEPLLKQAEWYARNKGYRNMKYIIGSTGMSCHGKSITDYADELKQLKSNGRKHFDYFVNYGFNPTGLIPNCYGENYHGIIMIKSLL